jgi:glutaredoxin 3
MTTIVIYSKDPCPYCEHAKAWLNSKQLTYTEHRVGVDGFTREDLLAAVPTARTVPQIIIDGKLIGGWDDLRASEFYASTNLG